MLDERSAAVLAAINGACTGGGFKIMEEEELARSLPEGGEDVEKTLSYLAENRFIELEYAEAGTYCVRPMPAGRAFAAQSAFEQREREKSRLEVLKFSALGAFLGGFAAMLLMGLARLLFRV